MKKMLFKLGAAVVLLALLLAGAGHFVIGKNICFYPEAANTLNWLAAKRKQMTAAAASAADGRIVLLGGSNAGFGLDAPLMSAQTGRTVVNYASHAGLGRYIFADARRVLLPGDTVFLFLEYEFYHHTLQMGSLSATALQCAAQGDRFYYQQAPLADRWQILRYALANPGYFWYGTKKRNKILTSSNHPYALASDGNMQNSDAPSANFLARLAKHEKEAAAAPAAARYQEWPLTEFINWCRGRNIQVYAFAPNYYHPAAVMSPREQETYRSIVSYYAECGVEFAGTLSDGFFSKEYMFDTQYHVNRSGRRLRTEKVIAFINGLNSRR